MNKPVLNLLEMYYLFVHLMYYLVDWPVELSVVVYPKILQ